MSNFCGQCGTPRPDAAKFCMTCGVRFDEVRTCPTCGQHWPEGAISSDQQPAGQSLNVDLTPARPAEGMYSTESGTVFFDGAQAWVAVDRGGFYMPDMSQPVSDFDPHAAGTTLVSENSQVDLDRPTGPSLGPQYVPGRDCGNCGFELSDTTAACSRCGSGNTGATFDPAFMS